MHINNEFKNGDIVALVISEDDAKGMVFCINVNVNKSITYSIAWGDRSNTTHFATELKLMETQENDVIQNQ